MTRNFSELKNIAYDLVKEKILGDRKGLIGEPNYMHSVRVHEIVSQLNEKVDEDLSLAALLHDVVEDGNVSFDELKKLGYSERTINLIKLCTHDVSIENNIERWVDMIHKLIKAKNKEAWYIKIIDISDNLSQSKGLSPESRKFMMETKAPIILRLTEWIGGDGKTFRDYLIDSISRAKNNF